PAAVLSHAVPTHTLPTRAFATGATPVTTHVSQLGQITGCRSFEGLQVVLGGSEQVTHDTVHIRVVDLLDRRAEIRDVGGLELDADLERGLGAGGPAPRPVVIHRLQAVSLIDTG